MGLGYGSVGMSAGKDGIGLSFGVGPSFGWAGFSKNTPLGEMDMNGFAGSGIYHHDFKEKKQ